MRLILSETVGHDVSTLDAMKTPFTLRSQVEQDRLIKPIKLIPRNEKANQTNATAFSALEGGIVQYESPAAVILEAGNDERIVALEALLRVICPDKFYLKTLTQPFLQSLPMLSC